jgi:hypothetical protein
MELYRLNLISKNNRKTGIYLYSPILKINGEFWRGASVISRIPLKTVHHTKLIATTLIQPEFYKANNITIN